MQTVATLVAFFLAVVVCGYGGAKWRWVPARFVSALNTFVIYLALPALIIRALSNQHLQTIDLSFVAAYLAAWLLVFVTITLTAWRLFADDVCAAIIQGYGGSYPNTGYLGLPVLVALLGDWALAPVTLIVAADVMVTIPIVLFMMEACQSRTTSWWSSVKVVLWRTLSQPLLMAVMIGFGLAAGRIELPVAVDHALQSVGVAAGPCALFALGASLAMRSFPQRYNEVAFLSVVKLVVHPVVAWFFMAIVFRVDAAWITVGLLAAALPTAATVFVLAEYYNTRVAVTSSTILVSTLGSLITVPIIVYITSLP